MVFYNIIKYIAVFFSCIALLIGCGAEYVQFSVTRPAEINLKGFNKIVIGDIQDQSGQISPHSLDISDKITSALFESKRFEVLDRQHITTLLKEHDLSVQGLVDEKTATKLGEFIGAAVFVFGRIQTDTYNENIEKDSEWVDKKGNHHQRIWRKGHYTLSVHLSLVDLKTTKILAIKDISSVSDNSTSADQSYPERIEVSTLYNKCLEKVTFEFIKLLAPYKVKVTAEFLKDNKLPELQQAIARFKRNDWDAGISLLESVAKREGLIPSLKAKALYDTGLAEMYTGRNEEAVQNLKEAISLDPKPMYSEALSQAKVEKEIADKVKQ